MYFSGFVTQYDARKNCYRLFTIFKRKTNNQRLNKDRHLFMSTAHSPPGGTPEVQRFF